MTVSALKMTPALWGLLVFLSVLWGGSFFFNGVAVKELPTLTIVLGRVSLAALALTAWIMIRGQRLENRIQVWCLFLLMGLLNNVIPFTLIVWGQSHIASGLAAIINATTPLFTVLAAHVFTRDEKVTADKLVGIAFGFVGVIILVGPSTMPGATTDLWAQLACLGAAVSYACAGIFGRRFAKLGVSSTMTANGQLIASALLLLPFVFVLDRPWLLPLPSLWALNAMLGLALFSTALAYVIFFHILNKAGATNLLLVTFLIPISATVLGVSFLEEELSVRAIAGMLLIGLGLVAIDGRLFSLASSTSAKQ